nr:carboxypeptidase-like regulatory domain-containing protein [Leifsonia psychrotolerans]
MPLTYTVSGNAYRTSGYGPYGISVSIDATHTATTDVNGEFVIADVANGTYDVTFSATDFAPQVQSVTVLDANVSMDPVQLVLLPQLAAGTVTLTGTPTVGATLTAVATGWPAGATLHYSWGAVGPHARHSNDLDVPDAPTLLVTDAMMGKRIWVQVDASLDGFSHSTGYFITAPPKLPTAAPIDGNAADLAEFLTQFGGVSQSQESTGLPAGALNPSKNYTANVTLAGDDLWADVYLYPSGTIVGTFPVINGVVQVELSAEVLSSLGAGVHTLVVTGQFFDAATSVDITIAAVLAETGFNGLVPAGTAALVLLLGAALLVARRRHSTTA